MAGQPVKVAFLADTSELRSSLAKAEQSMADAATGAQAAGDKMNTAFTGVADGADGVASASSQAAGGIGDLGGALSLLPGPLGALGAGMEAAAPAIMGVTGAADLLNLATTKFPVLAKAQAVATKALSISQAALNAVMSANPIALIIIAIIALIAVFVLLYKKNEAFRELVQKVWAVIKASVSGVVSWFMETAFPKIRDFATKAAAVFGIIKEGVTNFVAAAREKIAVAREVFDTLRTKVADIVGSYSGGGSGVLGKLFDIVSTIGTMKAAISSKAAGMWDGLKDSFRSVINSIIGWWNNLSFSLDIPNKIPGLPDSFSISTPNIPMLAEGGIVTRPTLAIIGEAGPEAVVPLNGRYAVGGGMQTVSIRLSADVLDQLARGKSYKADLDAYARAGGR